MLKVSVRRVMAPDGLEGAAAEVEEVVVGGDVGVVQDVGEDADDFVFGGGLGCGLWFVVCGGGGWGERVAVDFA